MPPPIGAQSSSRQAPRELAAAFQRPEPGRRDSSPANQEIIEMERRWEDALAAASPRRKAARDTANLRLPTPPKATALPAKAAML
jgi:hypothetical protein